MKVCIQAIKLMIVVIVVALLAAGCTANKGNKATVDEVSSLKVGVMVYRFDDNFITDMMAVMEEEAAVIGKSDQVVVDFDFVDAGNQQDIQYDQLLNFIKEDYDALAINLVDRSEAAKVISLAKEADIPIVFFNRQPVQEDMARWGKTYYVGTNGEYAGVLQSGIIKDYYVDHPEMDKNKDGILQYVMLQGQFGHQDAILRTQHSVRTLGELGVEIEELASDTANWQKSEAKDKMANWLDIFGDSIELVISNNDAMALGAIEAMKAEGIALIPTVGVDAIKPALDALEKGEMIGTVLNDAEFQGKGVIQIAYYLAMDQEPTEYIPEIEVGKYLWVPYQRITKE